MSIQKHRGAIDKIDAQIVKLLNRRTKHVLGIGQAKLASGKACLLYTSPSPRDS